MNALSLGAAIRDGLSLGQGLSWRDPDIDCTLVLSQPAVDPDLWAEFSLGAENSYRKHGVECASGPRCAAQRSRYRSCSSQ